MRHVLFLIRHMSVSCAVICAMTTLASAQTRPATQLPPATEASPDGKGFLDDLNRFWKAPGELFPSLSKPDAPKQDSLPADQPPASPAPAASSRLFPGMVTGRETCPRSVQGAPDCQAASDKLCQSKGYKSGKSLNTDTAFSCSPRQARAEGGKACGNEHFVTSAFCN